jgi:DNA-directed RNA polymerase subunit H (RpoH/RPB5)
MHDKLLKVVRTLETDYEPYGKVERDSSDCSCGCRHFVKLAGDVGKEWGVCANPESARAGLLTFEHQGCPEFEPILLDRALTDSQLRALIAEASEILKDRRRERTDSVAAEETPLPDERGEFTYDVKTSYFPHIKGHAPGIFRLEPHDGAFVAIPLASRTLGKQRPMIMGRYPAKNGEVFKIVRANGEYSYQVPFNGKIYNLKQFGDLSDIGICGLETLRPFLECVEPETFEKITSDAHARLKHAKRWLEENQDRVRRWRKREFWADETPANKREYREMLKEAGAEAERLPTMITEKEAFTEWLKGIDRSAPTLRFVPPPPAPKRQSEKRYYGM